MVHLDAVTELQIRGGTNNNSKIVFSSPEPKDPGELIGWEGSVVRRPLSVVVVRPQFQTTSPLKLLGQL